MMGYLIPRSSVIRVFIDLSFFRFIVYGKNSCYFFLSFSLAQIVHYVYGRNFCVKLNFELNSEHSPQFVGAKAEIPLIRDCGGASTKKKGFCGSEKNRGKAE